MATKDERPTLLSKMAMFVRNPTKDWSELDRPQSEEESGYDKQALKAMIERKRQNDFVRRREFDQLRKLRSRDASAVAALGRPSLFQSSSIGTDPDGRAITLKKIDEIEAQMSKQWWKGKQEGSGPQAAAQSTTTLKPELHTKADPASELPSVSISLLTEHFATTASPMNAPAGEDMGTGMTAGSRAAARSRMDGSAGAGGQFSTSRLFAIEDGEMATDPELEEAAIRFANGDDAGAEKGLLEALQGAHAAPSVALSWVAALLDLYRTTNNRVQFDRAVREFAVVLDGVLPAWFRMDGTEDALIAAPLANPDPAAPADLPVWDCPAELTVQAMEDLRGVLGTQPMPWHLGWSQVTSVAADAMPLLVGLFSSLCNEPVSLRFSGPERLLQTLRGMTPSGDRSVDTSWWGVRLDMLRTMHQQDEFEMVALDYCVTYEVAPPAWMDARCSYEKGASTAVGAHAASLATEPMPLEGGVVRTLELRGAVVGDSTQALAVLGGAGGKGDRIVVSCPALLRVDFAAAGSILNWVALRQADGCQVQFRDVHRLVAAFFNVIGINEHAQVIPRPM